MGFFLGYRTLPVGAYQVRRFMTILGVLIFSTTELLKLVSGLTPETAFWMLQLKEDTWLTEWNILWKYITWNRTFQMCLPRWCAVDVLKTAMERVKWRLLIAYFEYNTGIDEKMTDSKRRLLKKVRANLVSEFHSAVRASKFGIKQHVQSLKKKYEYGKVMKEDFECSSEDVDQLEADWKRAAEQMDGYYRDARVKANEIANTLEADCFVKLCVLSRNYKGYLVKTIGSVVYTTNPEKSRQISKATKELYQKAKKSVWYHYMSEENKLSLGTQWLSCFQLMRLMHEPVFIKSHGKPVGTLLKKRKVCLTRAT